MTYVVYKRFRGQGIDGYFNLPFGTVVQEHDGFLCHENRVICAATSENGWCHFRPNTPEGKYRQALLDALYKYYEKGKGDTSDFAEAKWKGAENFYWKNLLRTMNTPDLVAFYKQRIGKPPVRWE